MDSMREQVTYEEITEDSYDTTTGVVTRTPTEHLIRAFFIRFTDKEMQQGVFPSIQPSDRKVILLITEITFTISLHDRIRNKDGTWEIVEFKKDTSESIYMLQVRR